MNAKHTPGPWTWLDYPDGRKLLSGQNKAVIHCPAAPITCDPADMALIAAAPDLLEALNNLEHATRGSVLEGNPYAQEVIKAARAAVAKAKGL